MKRVKYYVLLFACLCLTGCGSIYNDPVDVSKEAVKRLSNNEYSNIYNLLNISDGFYKDDVMMKKYLETNDLDISGNKKIDVKSSKVDKEKGTATVEISIDNNLLFKTKLVKVNNKWLIDISDSLSKNFKITVPINSVVTLNDVVVDKSKYASQDKENGKITWGNDKYEFSTKYDIYTFSEILKDNYKLKVENDNIVTVNKNIYSEEDYYNTFTYASDKLHNEVKTFIEKYYNALNTALNNKSDFSVLKPYFDVDDTTLEKIKNTYDIYKARTNISSYEIRGVVENKNSNNWTFYHGEDAILGLNIIDTKCVKSYGFGIASISSSEEDSFRSTLRLARKDNSFVITSGFGFILEY